MRNIPGFPAAKALLEEHSRSASSLATKEFEVIRACRRLRRDGRGRRVFVVPRRRGRGPHVGTGHIHSEALMSEALAQGPQPRRAAA